MAISGDSYQKLTFLDPSALKAGVPMMANAKQQAVLKQDVKMALDELKLSGDNAATRKKIEDATGITDEGLSQWQKNFAGADGTLDETKFKKNGTDAMNAWFKGWVSRMYAQVQEDLTKPNA